MYTFCVHKKKSPRGVTRVGIRDLRSNLSNYLRRAHDGQVIQVTSRDEVVAELHPAFPAQDARRKPGTLKGKIRMAPDFDTLPEELIEAFEG